MKEHPLKYEANKQFRKAAALDEAVKRFGVRLMAHDNAFVVDELAPGEVTDFAIHDGALVACTRIDVLTFYNSRYYVHDELPEELRASILAWLKGKHK